MQGPCQAHTRYAMLPSESDSGTWQCARSPAHDELGTPKGSLFLHLDSNGLGLSAFQMQGFEGQGLSFA